jgi:hypothetical protein
MDEKAKLLGIATSLFVAWYSLTEISQETRNEQETLLLDVKGSRQPDWNRGVSSSCSEAKRLLEMEKQSLHKENPSVQKQ